MLTGKRGEVAWDPRQSWGFYQLGIWSSIYQWNSGFNINLYPYSTTNIAQFLSQYLGSFQARALNFSSFFFPSLLFPSSSFLSFIFRKVMYSVGLGTRSTDIYALANKPIHTRGIKTEKSLMSSQVTFYCKMLIKKASEFWISKLQRSDSLYGCLKRSLSTQNTLWPHLQQTSYKTTWSKGSCSGNVRSIVTGCTVDFRFSLP